MKFIIVVLFIMACFSVAGAQDENPDYDKALADSLGADEYGMRQYVLAILKAGSNKTQDKEELTRLFRGHMENIGRLAKEGKLVLAGPLGDNEKTYRGIFILKAETIAEADDIVKTDPAVSAGVFDIELYELYGSAALPLHLDFHKIIAKKNP